MKPLMSDTVTRVIAPATLAFRASQVVVRESEETDGMDCLNIPDGMSDRNVIILLALRCLEHEARVATTNVWKAQVVYLVERIKGYAGVF
jgi:hypothetical protein